MGEVISRLKFLRIPYYTKCVTLRWIITRFNKCSVVGKVPYKSSSVKTLNLTSLLQIHSNLKATVKNPRGSVKKNVP